MSNIRFAYNGADTIVQCEPVIYAVVAEASTIAGWPLGTIVDSRETSPTTWEMTADGKTVTAEVVS